MKPLLFMKVLIAASILFSPVLCHNAAQIAPQSSCAKYDDRDKLVSGNSATLYYIEVCKIPNQEGKPALSIVFTSTPSGDDAIRIYSNDAGKPLTLDGIYFERNGEKRFILHPNEIEWANGSKTQLDAIDAKKRKQFVGVLEAAFELLKGAADTHRIPSRDSQDRANLWKVVNFMFEYKINGKH
jgi:hypothetical protein